MSWKIGQKLVCIDTFNINPVVTMPKLNEIVTFNGVCPAYPTCIFLNEYTRTSKGTIPVYEADQFRPIDDTVTYDDLYEKFGSPERLDSPLKPTVKMPQTA